MIEFGELLEIIKAEALANKFDPDETAIWESICRDYSKKFFTPLHIVLRLDPEFVIRQVYAEQLAGVDIEEKLEDLVDAVRVIEDPDYLADEEADLQEFMEQAEREEKERIKKGLPLKSLFKKKAAPPKKEEPKKELPKSGGINLKALNLDPDNER